MVFTYVICQQMTLVTTHRDIFLKKIIFSYRFDLIKSLKQQKQEVIHIHGIHSYFKYTNKKVLRSDLDL